MDHSKEERIKMTNNHKVEQAIIDLKEIEVKLAQVRLNLKNIRVDVFYNGPSKNPEWGGVRMTFPFRDNKDCVLTYFENVEYELSILLNKLNKHEDPKGHQPYPFTKDE